MNKITNKSYNNCNVYVLKNLIKSMIVLKNINNINNVHINIL